MDLTTMLQDLLQQFLMISSRLQQVSLGLLTTFFGFELVVAIAWKKEDENVIKILSTRIIATYILYMFIRGYRTWTNLLKDSFVWLAGEATGSTSIDPSSDLSNFLSIGIHQLDKFKEVIGLDPSTWVYLFAWILGIAIFLIIALMIFVIYVEWGLMTGLGILFIPFIIFSKTRWMGEKVWSVIFTQNLRLFFIIVLYNFLYKYLEKPLISSSFSDVLIYLSGVAGIAFMVIKAPQLASGIATGVPTLDLSSIMGSASTVGKGIGAAGGNYVGGKVRGKMAQGADAIGGALGGAISNGAKYVGRKTMDAFRKK